MLAKMPFKSYCIDKSKPAVFLSDLQVEILQNLVAGKPAQVIAQNAGLSSRTIDYQIASIKKMSGCGSETELLNQWREYACSGLTT